MSIDEIDIIEDEIDDAPAYPLAAAEIETLTRCEAVIARGVQTFIEVGEALAVIRDGRLYRADFTTFEHYCRNKWGIGDSRARQLIGAATVAREIETVTNVTLPNEGQARAIAKAAPADRPSVIKRADALAGDKPRTAKHIEQAVQEIAEPDLPIDYSIVQRRLATHGVTLSYNDGMFVTHTAGKGTGIATPTWSNVTDRLARLEDQPAEATEEPVEPELSGRVAYEADERDDRAIIADVARILLQARQLIGTIKRATYQAAPIEAAVIREQARVFAVDQRDRLERMNAAAMISQTTFKQALDHLEAVIGPLS